jgi:uncharacterized membrane protein YbhN (UPF0104 family)
LATPQLLGSRVEEAMGALGAADPSWLWLAGAGFGVAVLAAAGSWRSALGLCGGRIGLADATARFGAGSLVNTFTPVHAGDAVRIGLFARALDQDERLWRAGGAFAALGAARAVVLAALVAAGVAARALPAWPLFVLVGIAAVAGVLAFAVRRRDAYGRAAHVFDAFRKLGREPGLACRLVAWVALSLGGKVLAAAAVGSALGIGSPVAAALVIVPALEVTGLVPLTPGNVGITSGAVAVVYHTHGTSFAAALAGGIAFHAVETAVGIAFGLGSLAWLAPYPSPGVRRIALLAAGASASLAVAGALSATVLIPLV